MTPPIGERLPAADLSPQLVASRFVPQLGALDPMDPDLPRLDEVCETLFFLTNALDDRLVGP